ncbi:DUF6884 domain-containing protein [Methylomonas sp. LWB]|uniref:DUF6884 domain-containing protein n=1 Tax=Methylomonas sp. LWB TaxID=1905845 RepID=UPI001115402B|nr:DUF6884 domain-containing protein [Methylomonas sp. LWB]
MAYHQRDLFEVGYYETFSALIDSCGEPATIVVGCGKSKLGESSAARNLYTSFRFRAACEIAETLNAKYYVLSGLYGLVEPSKVLPSYDFDIAVADSDHMIKWCKQIESMLKRKKNNIKKICLLANKIYSEAFMSVCSKQLQQVSVIAPLVSIDEFYYDDWHRKALSDSKRYRDLRQLYGLIKKSRLSGKTFLLSKLRNQSLPKRGVYVFLDLNEPNFLGEPGRIVRIGTHAVSEGSKATLKNRLRCHAGQIDGTGNHRGSIFRLHVGRALLVKEETVASLTSWGDGQNASAYIRNIEKQHELRVSEYLGSLEVFVIDADDVPSKNSLRASIERQLIALCSEDFQLIDHPSKEWLGQFSSMPTIVRSGLWNLRDVGRKYDADGSGSVSDIIRGFK